MGHGCFTSAIYEGSCCMFIHLYTNKKLITDPIATWTHQNAIETVEYHKALGKIKEHKMH